jgi:hypothetical protein
MDYSACAAFCHRFPAACAQGVHSHQGCCRERSIVLDVEQLSGQFGRDSPPRQVARDHRIVEHLGARDRDVAVHEVGELLRVAITDQVITVMPLSKSLHIASDWD